MDVWMFIFLLFFFLAWEDIKESFKQNEQQKKSNNDIAFSFSTILNHVFIFKSVRKFVDIIENTGHWFEKKEELKFIKKGVTIRPHIKHHILITLI